MAVSNNLGTGKARHSVRAVVGLAKFGAHGLTHPTQIVCHVHNSRKLRSEKFKPDKFVRLVSPI
jgi:hypothetical protein